MRILETDITDQTVHFLRVALGAVYIWFGALKVLGVSPVADLVAATLPAIPSAISVPAMGIWEVVIGLSLFTGWRLRAALVLFWMHIPGTFLVFLFQPEVAFQHGNPLLLTETGEFVLKNIVLVAAGLTITAHVRRDDRRSSRSSDTSASQTVEVFRAECSRCDSVVEMLRDRVSSSCEVIVRHLGVAEHEHRAQDLGVESVPAVAVDGELLDCCGTGVDETLIS